MTQYNPIKSEHIKIKNTLCMQCERQSRLMIASGGCPALSGSNQEFIKIKEDNHNESLFIIMATRRKRYLR